MSWYGARSEKILRRLSGIEAYGASVNRGTQHGERPNHEPGSLDP